MIVCKKLVSAALMARLVALILVVRGFICKNTLVYSYGENFFRGLVAFIVKFFF